MKTLLKVTLGLMASALLIASCNDDDDNNVQTTQEKIQHTWLVDSTTQRTVSSGADNTVTYTGTAADYFDFRSDGKLYYKVSVLPADTVAYSLIGDTKIVIDGDTSNIDTLTANKFVASFRTPATGTDYILSTSYLRR